MRCAVLVQVIALATFLSITAEAVPTIVVGQRPVVPMVVSVPTELRAMRLVELVETARQSAGERIGVDLVEEDHPLARECMTSPTQRHRLLCLFNQTFDTERPKDPQLLLVVVAFGTDDGDQLATLLLDLSKTHRLIDEAHNDLSVFDDDVIESGLSSRAVIDRGERTTIHDQSDARRFLVRLWASPTGTALQQFGSGDLTVTSEHVPVDVTLDGKRLTTISSTSGVRLTGLSTSAHRIGLTGEGILPFETGINVHCGINRVELHPLPRYTWAYDTLLYGGAGLVAAGLTLAAVAPVGTDHRCVIVPGGSCTRHLRPLTSVGLGVAVTGASWAITSLLLRDESTFPYVQTVVGILLGATVGVFGILSGYDESAK